MHILVYMYMGLNIHMHVDFFLTILPTILVSTMHHEGGGMGTLLIGVR